MTKRLSLRREPLTELTSADLSAVAGGEASAGPTCFSCIKCYTGITVCGLCDPH